MIESINWIYLIILILSWWILSSYYIATKKDSEKNETMMLIAFVIAIFWPIVSIGLILLMLGELGKTVIKKKG